MTYLTMQHIPLKSAYLCPDCDSIGNNSESCPACASTGLMNLASILDREVEAERILSLTYPRSIAGLTAMVA
jgi:RNA polymerase subunit RPABC4/transcription elongation factor Spt4